MQNSQNKAQENAVAGEVPTLPGSALLMEKNVATAVK